MKIQVNNQTKTADDDELTITLLFNNQTCQNCSYTGKRSRGAQQVSMLEILMYLSLVLIL